MYGTSQHEPQTTDWSALDPELASQANRAEARPNRRGEDTRRRSSVSSCPSPSCHIPDRIYLLPLAALDLSLRLFTLLRRAGVTTVGQILEMDLEALQLAKLGEKSILELIDHVQTLHLLDPVEQSLLEEEQNETAPAGRHDNRRRPGRGKLRAMPPHQPASSEELRIEGSALFCYKVSVGHLPDALRMTLPRWARCGSEQDQENKTDRCELPRRTRYCYVQPFVASETGELVEWRPGATGNAPSHYRAAATPDELHRAALIEVDQPEVQSLARDLVNPAAPSPLIRVAPAGFLTGQMREMIAPGVAFPSAEYAHSSEPTPIGEVFYYYPTGTSYDDAERGRLYLVYAALFVDRLDGSRSGPVEALWLTRAQLGQSLLWQRDLAKLDTLDLRTLVTRYAMARGATLPHLKGAEDQREAHHRQMSELEEQYNLVPLKDPEKSKIQKQEIPLELYISNEDWAEAKAHGETEMTMVLRVVERYMKHPAIQPVGNRLSRSLLEDICYWVGEDRQKRRELPSRTASKVPNRGRLVMHKVYVYHKQAIQNRVTGKIEMQDVPEQTGYQVIIGVLALTGVDDALIVHPRPQQPGQCKGPQPLVHRTPNFVPIEWGARVA